MAYKSKSKKKSIANACKVKAQNRVNTNFDASESDSDDSVTLLTSTEVTAWSGGVNNHLVVSKNDSDFNDTEWDSDSSEDEVDELEGDELVDSLQREIEHEICLLQELEPTPYERLMTVVTEKEWKRAEQKRGLGYNGHGERTQRKQQQEARERAEKDKIMRKR